MGAPRLVGATLCTLLLALAPSAASRGQASVAKVTYLTSSSVYVSAGEREGVVPGARMRVVTATSASPGDEAVLLEVVETSPHRSVCRVLAGPRKSVGVGADVEYEPVRLAPAQAAVSPREPVLARSGIHGRVGVRYLATRDGINENAEFRQPAVDLRLDGPALFGSPWAFHADVRARRTTRTVAGEDVDDDRSRVYRLAVGYDPAGPGWRFGVGRQVVPTLANIGFLDGVSVAYDRARWSAGAFAGSEPDPGNFGFSSDVRDYVGWWDYHSAPGAQRRWGLTAGLVGSYQESEVNRQYLFLHGRYSGSRLFARLTQEVDFNPGWKNDLGDSSVEQTSTFVSLRFEASRAIAVLAGYDNRRRVRLFRDRETPVTEFDDQFRRGAWLGARLRAGEHLRFDLQGRTHRGGEAGTADSYTGSVALVRMTRADLAVRLRATRYENDRLEGSLYSAEVRTNLGARLRLGLLAGVRDDGSLLNAALDDSVTWYGADLDIDLTRRLWASVSAERAEGDFEDVTQLYVSLAYRF
jgi:hypothetical protein